MSKLVKRMIKSAINRARKSSLVRAALEEVGGRKSYKVFGKFSDSRGNTFDLLKGLRDELKPGWETTLEPWSSKKMPSKRDTSIRISFAKSSVRKLVKILEAYSFSLKGKTILEIGCYDGTTTHILARHGAEQVVGSDIIAYYLHARPGVEGVTPSSEEHGNALVTLRDHMKKALSQDIGTKESVTLLEDDICSSSLTTGSFDLVCSWEVLEHVQDSKAAFNHIYRLLRPGGMVFHQYNPFFSLTGGHALCTLDFHWGHARLDENDFARYVQEVRPGEAAVARDSYMHNLNRMSLSDLGRYGKEAGFQTLALISWPSAGHLELVDEEILTQSVAVFPSVTLLDLVAPSVWVVQKKI